MYYETEFETPLERPCSRIADNARKDHVDGGLPLMSTWHSSQPDITVQVAEVLLYHEVKDRKHHSWGVTRETLSDH